MRPAGIVLIILGILGALIFGIQAIQDTETFSFLGIDIGVSGANWTPVIISVIVLVIGIVLMSLSKRTSAN
ncbi:MAG: transglycosylase [Bacteroidota bacterium]|nr:transglycosylase [Bacteroidota bacterium]